jgi:hypothetical protein
MKENVIDTGFWAGEHQNQSNTIINSRGDGQEGSRGVFPDRETAAYEGRFSV